MSTYMSISKTTYTKTEHVDITTIQLLKIILVKRHIARLNRHNKRLRFNSKPFYNLFI